MLKTSSLSVSILSQANLEKFPAKFVKLLRDPQMLLMVTLHSRVGHLTGKEWFDAKGRHCF